ncbi:MAG: isoprenylcysteine carboxylmethyltransferase family protein [Lunatimonas sp.]|uniref:methyltransferase family protein n=1 Tax=Lunatimonas sp. TaxID=2060141 RepID=UPI00263B86D7|nr:isoprenylcysteine carboxylmethyltransferase family protein [Lunatimonas sp.]MCC5936450.1 isoprenylcysteine carboxylmethyltransferase family protein [Lunatimonas sp.]
MGLLEARLLLYGVIFVLYHLTEFGLHRFIHGRFEYRSLLFSIPYVLAQLTLIGEYLLTQPYLSTPTWTFYVGGFGILLGLGFRWVAMLTARKSFHHLVQTRRSQNHHLVTKGPYKLVRHPAYLGWYLYSLSVPLFLGTQVSLFLFAGIGWYFFKQRIAYEEEWLISFFGDAYRSYKAHTHSGIPFIP